jgi:endonuclease-8
VPEGHTIHRLALDLAVDLVGAPVRASSPQGRFADGAAAIDGRVLERTDAHGKHLFLEHEGDLIVHVHLGLYGTFVRFAQPLPEPVGALRLRLETPEVGWDLRGATACELLGPAGKAAIVGRLGPDPIRRNADPERAWAALQRRRSTIGQALMDQAVVAGVGNVYRAEVLFAHGIHPLTPANEIERPLWDSIWAWLVEALRRGVKERRIVTVDPGEAGKSRRRMSVAESRYVYRQPNCLRCGTPVRRWDLAGRFAYACERCQPPVGQRLV